jgi:nucleoside-diphosphate-sugar epimerase
VLRAVAAAGVDAFVHASSVGTYCPGREDHLVDESWRRPTASRPPPTDEKAYVERMLDAFELDHPDVRDRLSDGNNERSSLPSVVP